MGAIYQAADFESKTHNHYELTPKTSRAVSYDILMCELASRITGLSWPANNEFTWTLASLRKESTRAEESPDGRSVLPNRPSGKTVSPENIIPLVWSNKQMLPAV